MPKLQTIQTNFSAGEFSAELEGRVDIEKYNSSCKLARNVVVLKQGGATIRPPFDFLAETHAGASGVVRPVPFIFSRNDAYMLEFGHNTMRVWRDGELIEASPGVPYVLNTGISQALLADMDFASGGDTMVLVHQQMAPKRLRRFADDVWIIDSVPLDPGALFEGGERLIHSVSIDNTAVGAGRTVTASGASFLESDVGRTVEWEAGVALITAFTSTTVVTATVTQAFLSSSAAVGDWVIAGTPQTTCNPSATGPVGDTITLTLGANGWRPTDPLGKYVEINGGLVELSAYSSGTVASGIVRRELTGSGTAPADAWVLLKQAWNPNEGYPGTVSFHQQRLWMGGTPQFPQSVWGSRSGLFFDFEPGTDDDSAVYKTADSDEASPLLWLVSTKSLLMLGYGAEFEGKGGIEKPITQTSMQINVESEWGADAVRPVSVGKEVLFAERGATTLRVLFPQQIEGYDSADVSIYSSHLLEPGLRSMSYERKPNSAIWACMQDGSFAAFTYNREQSLAAWCSGDTDGEVEWFATIPAGAEDVTYAVVRRTIEGVPKRYWERLNWGAGNGKFDSRLELSDTPAKSTWDGLDHLEGKTVAVAADGIYMGTFVVTGGEITLPRTALTISVGLPYTATLTLHAPEVGTGTGTAQGQAMSTNRIWVKLLNSVGLRVNSKTVEFRRLGANVLDQAVPPFSGLKDVTDYGWGDGESDIELVQDQGAPWTVLAVIRSLTVNAG